MSDNKSNQDPDDIQSGDNYPKKNEIHGKDTENEEDFMPDVNENSENDKKESDDIRIISKDTPGNGPDIKNSPLQPDHNIESKETESDPVKTDTNSSEKIPAESNNEEISARPSIPDINSKPKESNYQISLINENLLKVLVTTNRGVKIDSTVKEDMASTESQSNEINLHPRIDYSIQEVEVLIAIEELINEYSDEETGQKVTGELFDEIKEHEKDGAAEADEYSKSNYQLNLINENLLKIKILTNKSVRIESIAKDKKTSIQIQSNKTILKPKSENALQQIEITMAIEDAGLDERASKTEDGKSILIPNPEVVDLIRPPDYSSFNLRGNEYAVETENGYQNPFDSLRNLIRKNLTIGIIAAIILHTAVAAFAFYTISKKTKESAPEEPTRLIVLQDLPDPKIKLEDVEDPNKPKIEEEVVPPEKTSVPKRDFTPRRTIKPPVITRPKKEREDTRLDSSVEANLTRELDSLRKLTDETGKIDSSSTDTLKSANEVPDSLKNNFSENDIGLAMYFPKNWKLTDQRDINKNEKNFKGVVLTDTVAEQPGTMTMFIFLDNENKDYNAEDFKTEFKMNDSSISAFSKEPKTLAGFTEYRFYLFNKLGTEKLSLRASVRKQFFDQYKNEIEAVVRSIRIRKKDDL
ncbi:MAG: hypothetical protein ABI792_02205 [bacterium]